MTTKVAALPAYVDHAVSLPRAGPAVLGVGAWFKNTLCAAMDSTAVITATVGDLDGVESCRTHEQLAARLLDWLGEPPVAIAHDLHPDFHSTRTAVALAERLGVPAVPVQHHHAHIAAVCADHGHDSSIDGAEGMTGPVLGLALDGVGLGDDGTAWGGELLAVQGAECSRLGGLAPLPLPGGDRAAREPWRMAGAVLAALGRGDEIAHRFPAQPAAPGLAGLLESGLRCPPTSSMGRVFDAAAGLLGLCEVMAFEAEAAIALEAAAAAYGPGEVLADGWQIGPDGHLDLLPLLASLVDEPDPGAGAARFHATLSVALLDWVRRAAGDRGLSTVAVGGGCLLNSILAADLRRGCAQAGLRLLEPVRLSPGDTAIALGQAVVAHDALALTTSDVKVD